jgi:ABC-2 type transport system ATP-binding protein
MLVGLAAPTAGTALVFGGPYADLDDPGHRVGAIVESGDFDPGRSGRNHLCALALALQLPRERVEEVLDFVELTAVAHRPAGTYSLGMRQRLGPRRRAARRPGTPAARRASHWP